MPPQVGFEPTISAGERPQTYALDRAAIGIGCNIINTNEINNYKNNIILMQEIELSLTTAWRNIGGAEV